MAIPFRIAIAAMAVCATVASADRKDSAKAPAKSYMVVGEYINPQDTLPRIRYFADGQVSLNDRCAVRKVRLNDKMPPLYVNGKPVGFC